jgi:hypothetical protein
MLPFSLQSRSAPVSLSVAAVTPLLYADDSSRQYAEPAQQGACHRLACARVPGVRPRDVRWPHGVCISFVSSCHTFQPSPSLHNPSTSDYESLSASRANPMLRHPIQGSTLTRRAPIWLALLARVRDIKRRPSTRTRTDHR